jgi:hypothetical protein
MCCGPPEADSSSEDEAEAEADEWRAPSDESECEDEVVFLTAGNCGGA